VVHITLQAHGIEKLSDAARLDNVWDAVAEWGEETIGKNFTEGGRPEQWAAKKKDGMPSFLLVNGALRDSVESVRVSEGVDVGYGEEYGGFHRTGTKNMPQRDFGTVLDEDTRELNKVVSEALKAND
jgi:phage gpG-like protein